MGTGSASSEKPGRSAAAMAASAGGASGSGAGLDAGDAANSGIIRAVSQSHIYSFTLSSLRIVDLGRWLGR